MPNSMRERFDAGAAAWYSYNLGPLGSLRQELTWQNLLPHLPDTTADKPIRVLDAGGGSGELALRFVQHHYDVWLLDYSPSMLRLADEAARSLGLGHRSNLTLCAMAVEDAVETFEPGFFDVITCHTLIEYLADPRRTLHMLGSLLHARGLMSVSFVNRHAQVLRQIWSHGDPSAAQATLEDGEFCASLFDVQGKSFVAEEVSAWLTGSGFSVAATQGVRVFADFVPKARLKEPEFLAALLRLEMAAAVRHPYSQLARYIHIIAIKQPRPGPTQVENQTTPGKEA